MQPVWVLSVDLQTKTATFQSGLSDAAKSARGAFTDIKRGSEEMGQRVSGNMMEARHGVMLLGEEFGVHLPRGLTMFISSLGPVGAAMEAAFPFIAIAVGATLLLEHLAKLHEEGAKITEDQAQFATATRNAFNTLDEKLLEAGIRADELKNDHIGALKKQLELINMQSMDQLQHAFEEVAKRADVVFATLKTSWYEMGSGSTGAKHALDELGMKYEDLLSKGKDKDASDLLAGTKASAEKILALQKEGAANSGTLLSAPKDGADDSKAMEAQIGLKKAGVGWTEKEIGAQQELLAGIDEMIGREQRLAEIKKADVADAKDKTARTMSSEHAAAAREAAESQVRLGQQAVRGDKAIAEAQLSIKRASIQARLAVDLDFAQRDLDLALAGNAAQIAALDKLSKDYPERLKALHDKALELDASHAAQVAELTSKASVEKASKDLAAMEQGERAKIDATQKGGEARLAAINEAIKKEEAAGLSDTNFYRELLNQRVQLTEQMTEEQTKLTAEAGHIEAENIQKTGELSVQALKQSIAHQESIHRVSDQQRLAAQIAVAQAEYDVKIRALARDIAALDKNGQDYQNKLQEMQNKEKQLVQEFENEISGIKEKAEDERNQRISSAATQFNDSIARGLTGVLMRHQTFAQMIQSLGSQVVSSMVENSIKIMLQQDKERLGDARKAATSAFATGEKIGGPAGIILGPVFAAAAFAGVMAFQHGGVVPGVGFGDVVPAMLEPGEGVVPKGVMASLSELHKQGGLKGGQHTTHVHVHQTNHVNTIDHTGMEAALEEHSGILQKHVESTLRKMNK